MTRTANLLVSLTIGTGLYVLLSESWNLPYRLNLFLHPLVGLLATVVLVPYLVAHVRDRLHGQVELGPGRLALFFALPTVALAFVHMGDGAGAPWLITVVAIAVLAAPLYRMGRFLLTRLRHVPAVLLGAAALFAWSASLATSVALFDVAARPAARSALLLHRTVALLAAGVYVGHLVLVRLYRAEEDPSPGQARARADGTWALGAAGAVAAALGLLLAVEAALPRPRITAELSRVPEHQPDFAARPVLTGADAAAVTSSASCGLSGCHPRIVDDFRHSAHRVSPQAPHFQKLLDLMASEIGAEQTLACAACHYPLALVTEADDHRIYGEPDADAFACVSCHGIASVDLDEADPQRARYVFEPPLDHLRLLIDPDDPSRATELGLLLVRLNPIGHGRALTRAVRSENDLCLACHHEEIHPPASQGFQRPKCTECHMQAQAMIDRDGTRSNHVFLGSNTSTPHALGDEVQAELMRRWLTGDLKLYVDNWGSAWNLRDDGESQHANLFLRLEGEVEGDVHPGGEAVFVLTTTNGGIDHDFPASPLDLIEVWLEVEITDASGRVLLQSGSLDERHHVDPGAHRLGGRVFDRDGNPLDRHRVWVKGEEILDRAIAPDRPVEDRYPFTVPADATGPLHIRARWNHRKLAQDFVDWAYGEGATMPVVAIGTYEAGWPLGAPPSESARGPGDAPPAG